MDVRVKNYVASQEGWLSVTPGWHAIKYKDIGKVAQAALIQLQNILVFME